jgi:hypothetical protein
LSPEQALLAGLQAIEAVVAHRNTNQSQSGKADRRAHAPNLAIASFGDA